MNELIDKNKKVQNYGWSALITVVGFACALFAVSNWLISPVESKVSFFQGQIKSLQNCNDKTRDEMSSLLKEYTIYSTDTKRRDEVQERDVLRNNIYYTEIINKLSKRVSDIEKTFRGSCYDRSINNRNGIGD